METIFIKKQVNPASAEGFVYNIPAVGIRAKEGMRLIPHPFGTETASFESLELVLAQIHRAGYAAECEGKHYPPPSMENRIAKRPRPRLRQHPASPLLRTAEEALPALHEQLNDTAPSVVASAAFALGELRDENAINGLIHAFSNEDATVRKNAAEALAKIGRPALHALQLSLKDKHWLVRHSALAAINELIHLAFDLVPEILRDTLPLLKDESWLVRSQAAQVLGEAVKMQHQRDEKSTFSSPVKPLEEYD